VPVTWYPYPDTSGAGGPWYLSTAGNSTITLPSSATTVSYDPVIWSTTAGTTAADQLTPWVVTTTYEPREPTGEERAVRAEARRVARRAEEERRQARATVNDRAAALLLSVLDEVQAAQYRADQTFEVIGSHGGLYRIRPGTMANVDALDPVTREFIGRLCAHPREWDGNGRLPDPDLALGQLLDLTTDEPGFCRTANVHGGRRPDVAAPAA